MWKRPDSKSSSQATGSIFPRLNPPEIHLKHAIWMETSFLLESHACMSNVFTCQKFPQFYPIFLWVEIRGRGGVEEPGRRGKLEGDIGIAIQILVCSEPQENWSRI